MGAGALKQGNYARAVKLFKKSLGMYPLPGVEALLGQAERKLNGGSDSGTTGSTNGTRATNGSSSTSDSASSSAGRDAAGSSGASASSSSSRPAFTRRDSTASVNSSTTFATAATSTGADGRAYSQTQVDIVKKVLRAKEGGRGAHYRVLGIESDANESQIKKAYRKLALKLHPDKNSAPKADEAFKAVGLAYATLSDEQKRTIYDRYGDEDPDNRGGGSAGAGGMHFRRRGGARPGEVDPEDIFNMFFGGGPGGMGGMGGGPGFHVYSSGFGPGGVRFHQAGARPRGGGGAGGQQQQQQPEVPGLGTIFQFLPFFIIMLLSFFNLQGGSKENVYQTRYFSLTVSDTTNRLRMSLKLNASQASGGIGVCVCARALLLLLSL